MAKPIIYGNRKKGIQAGGTLDSAGNISIGGKDPTSPTGLSGTRNQATGYNPAKDPNYRAPSGRNKDVSTIKAPKKGATSSISSASSIPSWVTSGHEFVNGQWVYTKPLSEQGQQNVNQLVSGSTQKKSKTGFITNPFTGRLGGLQTSQYAGGGFGGGGGGSWGSAPVPKLEFSVIPGANQGGSFISPQNSSNTSQSTQQIHNNPQVTPGAGSFNDPLSKTMRFMGMVDENNKVSVPGVALNVGTAGLSGPVLKLAGGMVKYGGKVVSKATAWTSILNKAKGYGDDAFRAVKNLFSKGGDDALQAADDVLRNVERQAGSSLDDVTAAARMRAVEPALNATRTGLTAYSNLGRGLAIGVGAAVVGGTAYDAYNNAVNTAGQLRNSTAGTATNGTATGASSNASAQGQTSSQSSSTASAPAATKSTSTASSPTSFSSPSSSSTYSPTSLAGATSSVSSAGGGTGYSGSAGGMGIGGGGYANPMVSEELLRRQNAAQAAAMDLSRPSAGGAGVGVSPVGDQVNLAELSALRDKTRQMLDQYGADAVTMPEFKQNIQSLIAAGVENLRAIQPTPATPVVDTQEQADFLNQVDPMFQNDIRATIDGIRESLGMPDIERQKVDVTQKLNAVNEVYQKVIDQIKENPNLPKGLAARRLTEVFEDQKFAVSSLLAQLEMLDQQLETANGRLNQEMGIYQMEVAQQEKAMQRRIDMFGFLTESGAIGALSEKEIGQWSAATGIPTAAIQQMKANALDPKKSYDVHYETDAYGNVVATYINKANPLEMQQVSLGQIGKPMASTMSSGGGTSQPKDPKVATEEKDLTTSTRADLIETITANPNATVKDLVRVFPGVSDAVIEQYIAQYGAQPEKDTRSFWDKIADLWDF